MTSNSSSVISPLASRRRAISRGSISASNAAPTGRRRSVRTAQTIPMTTRATSPSEHQVQNRADEPPSAAPVSPTSPSPTTTRFSTSAFWVCRRSTGPAGRAVASDTHLLYSIARWDGSGVRPGEYPPFGGGGRFMRERMAVGGPPAHSWWPRRSLTIALRSAMRSLSVRT